MFLFISQYIWSNMRDSGMPVFDCKKSAWKKEWDSCNSNSTFEIVSNRPTFDHASSSEHYSTIWSKSYYKIYYKNRLASESQLYSELIKWLNYHLSFLLVTAKIFYNPIYILTSHLVNTKLFVLFHLIILTI